MEINGKTFYKKNNPALKLVVESHDNNIVIFSNGARCKLNTLMSDFAEEVINPEDFFDADKNFQRMKNEAVYSKTAPNTNEQAPIFENPIQMPNTAYVPAQVYQGNIERMPVEDTAIIHPGKNGEQTIVYQNVEPAEDPVFTIFKKMKRQVKYKIDISIDELLPKKEQLALMNDMFEIPASEYFAKDIVNKLLTDKSALIRIVTQQIENYINGEKPKKNGNKRTTNTIDTNDKEEALGNNSKDGGEETNAPTVSE